jgi:hypothetical protein
MNNLLIFAYSIAAQNLKRVATSCGTLSALSFADAKKQAERLAREAYPITEWADHVVSVVLLPL